MTHADKGINPVHFGSDPVDIRIRINPEIRIRIRDQILSLAKFALSERKLGEVCALGVLCSFCF